MRIFFNIAAWTFLLVTVVAVDTSIWDDFKRGKWGYPSWVEVRHYPEPDGCNSDKDCLEGQAKCLQGECHCNDPKAYGDGKYHCVTRMVYKCYQHLEHHCQKSELYNNSHCIWTYHFGDEILFCKCDEGHFGRAGVLGCLKAGDDPDGKRPCLANHYCPNLSFCNLKTKRCQCKKGLVGNGVICRPAPGRQGCKSNGDCKPWSYCKDATCHCRDELLGNGIECNPAPRKKCTKKSDCHAWARCMNGYCVCDEAAGNGEYCRKPYRPCYPHNPCGWDINCAVDRLNNAHQWCLCKVGTDKDGNCVECFTDKDCAKIKGKCVNNKCKCREDLVLCSSRCVSDDKPQLCKRDQNCHAKAKCEDGRCVCRNNTVGNGIYCREGGKCPRWLTRKCGSSGKCLLDPYLPRGDYYCSCFKGFYYNWPFGCIECKSHKECPMSATCQYDRCRCKDELMKKGKECLPAPVHKCKKQSDCHKNAKCFFGECICQGNTTGNGRFCREVVPCSNDTLVKCGEHSASCIADPLLPHIPICKCLKGFTLSKKNKCVDIDECKTLKSRCGDRCRNTIGSFYCDKCPRGYAEGRDGSCIAPDQCDCGQNEECYDGECFCKEGYDRDEFGQCFWPEKDLLLTDETTSAQAFSGSCWVTIGLLGYQVIFV